MLADIAFETLEWLQGIYRCIFRKSVPKPSLLALNVDWFTHCNWLDQLIAFKQIDSYLSNKH